MSNLKENWGTGQERENIFTKGSIRVSSYANRDRWLEELKLTNKKAPTRVQLALCVACTSAGAAFHSVRDVAVCKSICFSRPPKSFVLDGRGPTSRGRGFIP